tara:strand:+ start:351 stop:560 length:210 start_codon:yes stop_codon:yes gene_type:complete
MFNWFKKNKKSEVEDSPRQEFRDAIEESLWEIKEEYDLPTEEIVNVVQSKRDNLDYMHKIFSKSKNNKN